MERIAFDVHGIAQPKGSTRMLPLRGKRGARAIITSANPKASAWQQTIAWTARQHYNRGLLFGPITIGATFYLPRPKTAPRSVTAPIRKPDLDKLTRCLCDALTGVIYHDDAQVIECYARKRFAADPYTAVVITECEWPEASES